MTMNLEGKLPDGILRKRVEQFLSVLLDEMSLRPRSAFLIGLAARGEFSETNADIRFLLIFDQIDTTLLDKIAALGRRFGKLGIRAPFLMTAEAVRHGQDAFPIELLDMKHHHVLLLGEPLLDGVEIASRDLRLEVERGLRLWGLRLRQGYLKSAGDQKWMAKWFVEHVTDIFPLLRAFVYLQKGNSEKGNTDTAAILSQLTGVDLAAFIEVWDLRKVGRIPKKEDVRRLFDRWETALEALAEKINDLAV